MLATVLVVGLQACGDDGGVGGGDTGIGRSDGAATDGGPSDGAAPDGGVLPTDGGTTTACAAPETHSGDGTFYDFADGSGNCSFPATPDDLMVAAMNDTDYAGSAVCGSCAEITGPSGVVTVRIVDRCPECPQGDIDLSPDAFSHIADLSAGRVPITWHYVPCDVSGPVVYHFKDGSNPWWTAVQIRNHRHAIARFEYLAADGSFQEVARVDYNYFVESSGMGEGPFTFRITDVYGDTLVDEGIPLLDDADAPGAGQFPPCSP